MARASSDYNFWTPEQMADELQVSTEYLSQLRSRGTGPPFVKVGKTVRYVRASVWAWCQENATTSTGRANARQVF